MKKKPLYLTNTLTDEKELFQSLIPDEVTIYHCGPTVYWTQHIGNMRAVVLADLIARTFIANDYKVNFIRNYTDVGHLTGDNNGDADAGEDRMEKASKRENLDPLEIAKKYISEFEEDIAALGVKTENDNNFTYQKPRATGHIQEMIEMVQILLDKGVAYSTPLAIYFDTSKKPDYNKLSKQKIEFQKINQGHGEIDDSANKKNPSDFALWFFKAGKHQNALQTWESPFYSELVQNGQGFPGWHIECSAMCLKCSGLKTIDIHMGGIEHIPVHHTNEIAQSESANGTPLSNYWLHNEHLLFEGGKMSKSSGTSITIDDLAKIDLFKYYVVFNSDKTINEQESFKLKRKEAANTLRFFFLQSHYRSKQNFTEESFRSAKESINSIINKLEEAREFNESMNGFAGPTNFDTDIDQVVDSFYEAINNDFNFPEALAVIFKIAGSSYTPKIKLEKLKELLYELGLEFIWKARSVPPEDLEQGLYDIFMQRQIARKEKNWAESDRLRKEFEEKSCYELRDHKNGETLIYPKSYNFSVNSR